MNRKPLAVIRARALASSSGPWEQRFVERRPTKPSEKSVPKFECANKNG